MLDRLGADMDAKNIQGKKVRKRKKRKLWMTASTATVWGNVRVGGFE